jgi:hypothetical protein
MSYSLVVLGDVSSDYFFAYLVPYASDTITVFPEFSAPELPFYLWEPQEYLSGGYPF